MVLFKLLPGCQSSFSPLFQNNYEDERQNDELRLIQTTCRTPSATAKPLHAVIHINRWHSIQLTADNWHRPVIAYQEKYQSLCYPWMRNVTLTDFTHTACAVTLDSPRCHTVNFARLLFTTKPSLRQSMSCTAGQQLHPTHVRVPATFRWE